MTSALSRIPLVGRFFRCVDPSMVDVLDFWKAMRAQYGTQLLDPTNIVDNGVLNQLMDVLGVVHRQAFLRMHSLTVDSRIHVPFIVGASTSEFRYWDQIRECVHVHHHISQGRVSGGLGFQWNYYTNPAQRALYEAEALRCDVVMERRYRGKLTNPRAIVTKIRAYGCPGEDVEVAERFLEASMSSIKAGAMPSDVCAWACRWLDEHWHWKE